MPTVTPPTTTVLSPGAPALRVTLPGGLVVSSVAHQVGATSLTQALSLIGQANAALAPLGPIFTIIDAVLSVKAFAEAVPELIVNPGAVVEAIVGLVQKIGRLASIIPQLSVPLMILGVVDVVLALLEGLTLELQAIAAQETKIATARAVAVELPVGARAALEALADVSAASVVVQRTDIATTASSAGPLLAIVNVFCGLIGLEPLVLELGAGGSTAEMASSLATAVQVLTAFRSSIPL